MKLEWGILLLSCVATLDTHHSHGRQAFRCDYTFFEEADGFLKFQEMPSNWHEARIRCKLEGAKLASPLNHGLRTAIKKMMDEKKLSGAIFTGIQATFSKGDFSSLEGVPLAKIPHYWAANEPDNYKDGDDCIVLLPDGYSMADVPCTETFPYMCYANRHAIGKYMDYCGTTDPDYSFEARTGSCYKFHKAPRPWWEAYKICAAEGGYLAILNSDTEATVIKEIYDKNPQNSIPGNFDKNNAYVGAYDLGHHGDWLTIHDETFKEAGYDKFASGEPNNANKDEFCIAVTRNAMFNDISCKDRCVFICEKDTESLKCVNN